MKLQELANMSQTKKISKIMESHFGNTFSFDRLTRSQAFGMLKRVRTMISEQRNSSKLHTSEQNPAYLKLIMLEQALASRVNEVQPYVASDKDEGPEAPIVRGGQKEVMQAMRSQPSGPRSAGQKSRPIVRGQQTAESKKQKIREASELQQAQVVLASQDMIDEIQDMIESISEMQFKDLPALTDQAKTEIDPGAANQFQQAANEALTGLLAAVQQGKAAMEAAQGVLTGQAPAAVPGAEAMPAGAPGAAPMTAGAPGAASMGGEEIPAAPAAQEPAETPAPSRALGRGRR